ncbi:hypothetical protein EJ02DRAFT_57732 [Clathrospora elynae]|uniref:Uncharacterized protein n=1 Tax=Clathrospora elynae TaxID=706981 RepID=A0A6A5SCJ8_9PLEO|nr:hypothetical protein EJ02DRAFT_57732 [Clathrospora elynae]
MHDNLSELQNLPSCKTEAFEIILSLLEHAGVTIVHNVSIAGARGYEALPKEAKDIILHTNMKIAINTYLASLATNPNNIRDLQDLIDFRKTCPGEEYSQRNVSMGPSREHERKA